MTTNAKEDCVDVYQTILEELTEWVPDEIAVITDVSAGICRVYTPRDPDWPQILERHAAGARKIRAKLAAGELGDSEHLLTAMVEAEGFDGLDGQVGKTIKPYEARRRRRRFSQGARR